MLEESEDPAQGDQIISDPPSSSGRIPDFESGERGSNPRGGTNTLDLLVRLYH